jgi:hypothetical protein
VRPADQTTFGFPDGNCFSACVASLLEVDVAEVPWFMGHDEWWPHFEAWLRPRGYYALCCPLGDYRPPGFHILSGKSPRGDYMHSVVARGAEVVHDPHPSRAGLDSRVDFIVLVPFDPARGAP